MKRWIGWTVAAAVGLAIVAAGALALQVRRAELAAAPRFAEAPLAVHTATAEAGRLTTTRSYLATVEPKRRAGVTADVTAPVTAVPVDEGTRVDQGDVLVRLRTAEVDARLAATRADIARARAERDAERANLNALDETVAYWKGELDRDRSLSKRGTVSDSEVKRTVERLNEVKGRRNSARHNLAALRAQIRSLEAKREENRAQKADYVLDAPFAGQVTARHVDPGDQATPGKALVTIATTDRLRLSFGVPQADLDAIAEGQTVRFGDDRTARIDRLHPELDDARLARAEADLGAGIPQKLGAWMHAQVVTGQTRPLALIPVGALAGRDGPDATVYAVADGRAHARRVTVEGQRGDRVAVSGVEPGTPVAVSPYPAWTRLSDGRRVKALSP